MEFSGDVAPQPLPAAEAETEIPPEAEPEMSEKPGGEPHWQSGRYPLTQSISVTDRGEHIWRGDVTPWTDWTIIMHYSYIM